MVLFLRAFPCPGYASIGNSRGLPLTVRGFRGLKFGFLCFEGETLTKFSSDTPRGSGDEDKLYAMVHPCDVYRQSVRSILQLEDFEVEIDKQRLRQLPPS